ncbi:MAG: HNH endonuclease [Gammaproteobacteria bacterium]|nr:HNH endonuclease [Gammaproteobacteria bacterium]
MAKLTMLKPSLQAIDTRTLKPATVSDTRITGRRLQNRRYSIWKRDPHCAGCGRVVGYPGGFELDHIVPLYQGGPDTEENCQVLCIHVEIVDGQRVKTGCHVGKTAEDTRQ